MHNAVATWQRYSIDEIPVYISTTTANWFVPNTEGDRLLQKLSHDPEKNGSAEQLFFLDRLPENRPADYRGRHNAIELKHIHELWFHLTNRCNMSCTHCLFSSSPSAEEQISAASVLQLADEAWQTGCRLFALTGGEPLVHPEINTIVRGLLALEGTHVVILTNGLLADRLSAAFPDDIDRIHLQISVDGIGENHDKLRGKGAFERLTDDIMKLRSRQIPCTLSMCITQSNIADMEHVIEYAADNGVANVHYMWYFVRGRGTENQFVDPDTLFEALSRAEKKAREYGVHIDNIESLRTRVFSPPGTIHDGTTAGWESLAVGPDGHLYPTAALVGMQELATPIDAGLVDAWMKSPVLERIRNASIVDSRSPMRFILGGGDLDHSYISSGSFSGAHDPYLPLYEKSALHLISGLAPESRLNGKPSIRLQMGEILESCAAHGSVALVHSNCLLAAATNDSRRSIRDFYSSAAENRNDDILNPVGYGTSLVSHIPENYRFRGYGCGSPVMDAGIDDGEHIVDLGCGTGVECFIAARLVGSDGSVTGVDMLEPMLKIAEKAKQGVSASLGYDNVRFRRGMLENLPLDNRSADVVLSNCVMNLSLDKRRSWKEVLRVLKPGGRLVISDVVCETEPDASIRNDETLKGECIAGALTETHLFGLLEETGFENIRLIKRFPYRTVENHPFFSLTFSANRPFTSESVKAMYRGPLPWLKTSRGTLLSRGKIIAIDRSEAETLGEDLFLLDNDERVTNIGQENCCSCALPPEEKPKAVPEADHQPETHHASGCMVCGAPLVYEDLETDRSCSYCGKTFTSQAVCSSGHYICDNCHSDDAVEVIRHLCVTTTETDMIRLFEHIRSHPAIKIHGPEYHAIVPGVILATWRNLGGRIIDMNIESGINRGKSVTGGSCGFYGICGAAVGAGIAFSIMLGATPLKPDERKAVQQITTAVLEEIASLKAARCCQRDCWIALKKAAELSNQLFDISLRAEYAIKCSQQEENFECVREECPVF